MSRRSRGGRLPRWYRGKLLRDFYSGWWYGEREGKLFNQEGKLVDRKNFDTVTDRQRAEDLKRRLQ